jgi:hypothetical protein
VGEPGGLDIPHAIQLAIAPVFLLSALGTILGVLSTRLARIVDRTRRVLELRDAAPETHRQPHERELRVLDTRRKLVNTAIAAGTVAALCVCVLIAIAFVGTLVNRSPATIVAGLFVLAMLAFITALVQFLREVIAASRGNHGNFSSTPE